jgi:hypothetical protein
MWSCLSLYKRSRSCTEMHRLQLYSNKQNEIRVCWYVSEH